MEDALIITEIQKNIAKMMCKAAVERPFRALCLADCAQAYRAFAGRELPERFFVTFTEKAQPQEQRETPCCVLPEYLPPTWMD